MRSSRRVLPFLCALVVLGGATRAQAYVFNGYHWADGTNIMMHLQLERTVVPLQDGSASWNDSAADALTIWNQYIGKVKFVAADPVPLAAGDGINSVVFANDIYGDAFGSTTLAVTTYFSSSPGVFRETDVIFNNLRKWNSYRGPQQGTGYNALYDLHRVALHEFGHALGLDHPDEHGQAGIEAIMNSVISDLDHLADDDIAGAHALYDFKITSSQGPLTVRSGDPFSYQITAPNSPTNFSAVGLPPGLQVDAGTGLISGSCPTSGSFYVYLVAEGTAGRATGHVSLSVTPLPLTSSLTPPAILLGDSFSYQITAGNMPTTFSAETLPAGLSLDPNTGLITGTPTVGGIFLVKITAHGATAEASASVRIEITAPRITSANYPPPIELGDSFTYQITATHTPTSYSATGLPPGFQLDAATGIISGVATQAGIYSATISVATAYGNASTYLRITINAPRVTSLTSVNGGRVGTSFTYQITASNHPTSFSATNLPDGLSLDPTTGKITGTPTLSGISNFQVTAHGAVGDATATISFNVFPADPYNPPVKTLSSRSDFSVVADPVRPRIYVKDSDNLVILDSDTLAPVESIYLPASGTSLPGSGNMELSPDNSKLYVAGGYLHIIYVIDIEHLIFLPNINVGAHVPGLIKAGADGMLYLAEAGKVYEIDPATGATVNQFTPDTRNLLYPVGLTLKLSPDRRTLFVAETGYFTGVLGKYSLSQGAAPTLLQSITATDASTSLQRLIVTPDGQAIGLINLANGGGKFLPIVMHSTADLNVIVGELPATAATSNLTFSADGAYAVETYYNASRIDVIDVARRAIIRTLIPPDRALGRTYGLDDSIAIGRSNAYLFTGGISSATASFALYVYPLLAPPSPPKSLINVSTRLRAQTGDDVLIGGFIIEGNAPKSVALRAIGPSLPLTGVLADPVLELHASDGSIIASNNNWNEHRQDVLNSNYAPGNERDSVIIASLQPGPYTAIVRGLANTTGIALVELYDLSPESDSHIANISTRGKVETDDNVMIAGFIIGGDQPTKVLVRALGPSLVPYGLPNALTDTTLDLFDSNGNKFASNDDWQSDQAQEIIDTGKPLDDPRESALVRTLAPGPYTAIVRGKNNTTGVALVEVYNLELPPSP
ncbi:MAG: putative Ig domain-containing protein [Verrucomicrobiota bacterium]|nr:putative Ig domain-containing protein [Verrucomicrobiota bacterium]